MVPVNTFTLERDALIPDLPTLALKVINLILPHMSLQLFELLLLCWKPQSVSL